VTSRGRVQQLIVRVSYDQLVLDFSWVKFYQNPGLLSGKDSAIDQFLTSTNPASVHHLNCLDFLMVSQSVNKK